MSESLEGQLLMNTAAADDAVQTFVGKNYGYYQRKWLLAHGSIKGFNVAAFFLGVVWMVYRKMYLYTAIVMALLIIDVLIETYFPLPEALGKAITWGIYATFGILGNMIYKSHVDKKLNEISTAFPPEQVSAELAKQGGVNLAGAWAFGVSLLVLVGIAVWIIVSEV
ncbi:DUF2628 domain-containing protein [Methylotenera sp.]|uniref:DUF2628 domain-containing protein n=1 Tax=Methylotenera sp. TaxID=2051956 RepID=UPI002489FA0A|nr:DUF2628 domain-containing protein [Methylotenera sp.]MDI1298014.1 DUF2628 domain-containing protein [Methylotenera sp.]